MDDIYIVSIVPMNIYFLLLTYFRDLNITYVVSIATGFVFEESHAKTLKNSDKILLRIKLLFKNVYFSIKNNKSSA